MLQQVQRESFIDSSINSEPIVAKWELVKNLPSVPIAVSAWNRAACFANLSNDLF